MMMMMMTSLLKCVCQQRSDAGLAGHEAVVREEEEEEDTVSRLQGAEPRRRGPGRRDCARESLVPVRLRRTHEGRRRRLSAPCASHLPARHGLRPPTEVNSKY